MLQLMHVEHHATNVVRKKILFETASRWIYERIRGDDALSTETRGDPASVNLLHNLLIDDQPTTTDRQAALAFVALVERFTGKAPVDQAAIAALEVADGIRQLATEHEILHLTLV